MEYTSVVYPRMSRPGYLAEVTLALLHISDTRASGRLSVRNAERFGLTHLYFNQARLIHITGDKCDGEVMLNDLLTWTKGSVRFDPAVELYYETLTWQQAQLFTRWLTFLEMRGIMHGIPRNRLDGFAYSMSAHLPREPIALPKEVEQHEEPEEALIHQWQRLHEGFHHLFEHALTEEQREQLRQVSHHMNDLVHQASDVTQDLAKRAAKATQEGLLQAAEVAQEAARQSVQHAEVIVRQAFNQDHRQKLLESTQRTVESVRQAAETVRQSALRAEDLMKQTFNEDRRQQIIQSMQDTVETVKLTVSQSVSQTVDDTLPQTESPLPPELQAMSIRPMRSFQSPSPAINGSGEG
ncbi:MAG TPA: hypothetical protein VF844_08880 [Ktedonobacteraceae bacterium]